jgi:CheY-like chemotaxis protein/predicted regulator of Ras-like GTPase activity (Roadblock/LC7/MglB family)
MVESMTADKRVLIVDDEEKVVFFLRESLEELGRDFTIGTAGSAEEALEKIEIHPYDLVISDLRMPGADGLQLLERVKQSHPHTRFILMTAYGSDEVEAKAKGLEVYDYITKPFHVSDLLRVTRHALADVAAREERSTESPEDKMEAVSRTLSNLRFEVGAQCVLLADIKGHVVSEVGITQGLETGTLMPLVANGLSSVSGIAQYLQDEETFNLHFHEGKKFDIYSTSVGDDLFLTLIFDRGKQPSRIGMVWLYAKRAIQDLLKILYGMGFEEEPEEEPRAIQESIPPQEIEPLLEVPEAQEMVESAFSMATEPEDNGQEPAEATVSSSTFGIEEALRKGLIDEDFAQLLKGED